MPYVSPTSSLSNNNDRIDELLYENVNCKLNDCSNVRAKKLMCTAVCGSEQTQKNCSQTLLVAVTMDGVPNKSKRIYCIIDGISTTSFIDDELLQFWRKKFPRKEFSIKIGPKVPGMEFSGRTVTGLKVLGVMSVQVALTFNRRTDVRDEVATPEITRKFAHCHNYAHLIPEFDPTATEQMLSERTCLRATCTEIWSPMMPNWHHTPLGVNITGIVCLTSGENFNSNGHKQPTHCMMTQTTGSALHTDVLPTTSVHPTPLGVEAAGLICCPQSELFRSGGHGVRHGKTQAHHRPPDT